jgi:hypothetical protein
LPFTVENQGQNRADPAEDSMATKRSEWPVLVRLGLLGISNPTVAWMFALGSFVVAIVFLAMRSFTIGAAFFLASCWYYWAIRWVNHNGGGR